MVEVRNGEIFYDSGIDVFLNVHLYCFFRYPRHKQDAEGK